MSGSTTELSLSTAVDADDNADYLTINLANSLRTLDGLFNNVTGHTHGGAHQGGPVDVSSIPNASITNAKLGSDVARANLLTNGGFEIWQRGNSFSAPGVVTADRWTSAISTSTAIFSASSAWVPAGSGLSLQIAYTNVGSGFAGVTQKIENVAQLRGKTVTASVLIAADAAAPRTWIELAGTVLGNQTGNAIVGVVGAWTRSSVTVTVPANETLLSVNIWVNTGSGNVFYDNAMLVIGSVAADYAALHPADDLLRCQRYYEVIGRAATQNMFAGGMLFSTSAATFTQFWKVNKPVIPTITFSPLNTFQIQSTSTQTLSSLSASGTNGDGTAIVVGSGTAFGVVGGNAMLSAASGANAFMYIESNP